MNKGDQVLLQGVGSDPPIAGLLSDVIHQLRQAQSGGASLFQPVGIFAQGGQFKVDIQTDLGWPLGMLGVEFADMRTLEVPSAVFADSDLGAQPLPEDRQGQLEGISAGLTLSQVLSPVCALNN